MSKQQNTYGGTCYIGVVGPENEIGECRDSIENITRRNGDSHPHFIRATKGYEARQMHFAQWLRGTQHPYMLLLDHDMIFEPDTLERLRNHRLPYVSGYYLRRRYQPIAPVWFELGKRGSFPLKPWTAEPDRGKLHQLGASGWGCILLHRDVAVGVAQQIKGEQFVIEDDMDVYPYDLSAIVESIKALRTLTTEKPSETTLYPALNEHVATLEKEIRPLRVAKDVVGSDIRFPFFAREAGFVLVGDPNVRPGHVLNYPLDPDDYSAITGDLLIKTHGDILGDWGEEVKRLREIRKAIK